MFYEHTNFSAFGAFDWAELNSNHASGYNRGSEL